ncbi:MAG TPA: RecX family transcriptional regulator, partial [Anseongella sp.]|nr:RecX family transcriptional regulator [Anseongella sp.]
LITDKKAALEKGARYCAYQERSQQEVRSKLYGLGVAGRLVEEVISTLIEDGFINEERFARAYSGGKFRVKGWGRVKIRRGLQSKGVSDFCIRAGLEEIDESAYLEKLTAILEEKLADPAEADPFKKKNKAVAYAVSRGFEAPLVWEVLKSLQEAG